MISILYNLENENKGEGGEDVNSQGSKRHKPDRTEVMDLAALVASKVEDQLAQGNS